MAADSPTPGAETCPNGCHLDYYGTHQGPPDCDRLPRDPNWNNPNPAGPTERLAAPSPVDTTEPPTEAQQGDDTIANTPEQVRAWTLGWMAGRAARPSADTETLRRVQELVDEITAAQWSPDLHDVLARLRATLDAR